MNFETAYMQLYIELGESKKMVLSTCLKNIVTSRMMSIIILDKKFYFQTDKNFRKYRQLKENPNISLCIDNIQIEGQCKELGKPCDQMEFVEAYKKNFPSSFTRYTLLKNERLFVVIPTFIERWKYVDGDPYIEIFDVINKRYSFTHYVGEL